MSEIREAFDEAKRKLAAAPVGMLIIGFVLWTLILAALLREITDDPTIWMQIVFAIGILPALIGSYGYYWELTNRVENGVRSLYRLWKASRR